MRIVEMWILARLRHYKFFSLVELNKQIALCLELLNTRPFKKLEGSRLSKFDEIDRPALKPLPQRPYIYAEWKKVRVHPDYHVEIDGHYYSVHYTFVKQQLEARITAVTVEIYHHHKRVASHIRSYRKGSHTTTSDHMPKAHQAQMEWTPGRFLAWATGIGPATRELVNHLLTSKPHPEQGYRSCLGLLGLVKRFGAQRLEAACARAIAIGSLRRHSVVSILEGGLDQVALVNQEETEPVVTAVHRNVRGATYYN